MNMKYVNIDILKIGLFVNIKLMYFNIKVLF